MMSERHGVPSEPEGGGVDSPSPLHGPASSSFKCCLPGASAKALLLLRDALPCLEGKLPRSPFWTPAWVSRGRRAWRLAPTSSLGPALCLLSFQQGIRFRAGAVAHIFLPMRRSGLLGARPPCLGSGDQPLLPPLTQRQTLGHSAAQTREGWLGVWVVFPQVQSGLMGCCCLANSHQTSPLHWPQLYSFLWTKWVGSPSPRGLGVKQQPLTEP